MITQLLNLLKTHKPVNDVEAEHLAKTTAFVEATPDCLVRSQKAGHITGSAWIVSPDYSKVLLIHHKGLGKWLQPGGHCDGDGDVCAVACRETEEETGLKNFTVAAGGIFDIDVHTIPARTHPEHGFEPEHLHYDIRFLLVADPNTPLHMEEGALLGIKWMNIDDVPMSDKWGGKARMVEKTKRLREAAAA